VKEYNGQLKQAMMLHSTRKPILTIKTETKLVGYGIKARLAGQEGIGLFAKEELGFDDSLAGPSGHLYEEQPLFTMEAYLMFVNNSELHRKHNSLSTAQLHAFKHMPAIQPLDRNSLLDLFRVTSFGVHANYTPCYNIYAMTNSSCSPNTHYTLSAATRGLTIFLIRGISAGEELTFTYTASVACMTTAQRQAFFSGTGAIDSYTCRCDLCCMSEDLRLLGDMRRCVMRHLLHLMTGHDLPDVPRRIRHMKQDKFGSKQWHWHLQLLDVLAKVERVDWLVKKLKGNAGRGIDLSAMLSGL
jgi:hypothetical protein